MILSSADILRILGGNQIIRLAASVEIVEGKPALTGREGLFIYIKRYPELSEFEATFTLWIESDGSEPDDLIVAQLQRILPRVEVTPGLMTEIRTTELRSENTLGAPQAAPVPQVDTTALEARFEALAEDVQDRMLLVRPGRDGRDGKDGRDGADGRDGRDLLATDASLGDLKDVSGEPPTNGHVLTWVETMGQWMPKPTQSFTSISGGGGGGGGAGLKHWEETESGDLLPVNAGQSIGSSARPLKELWVEGQTIYVDDKPLGVRPADGRLMFDGQLLALGDTAATYDSIGALPDVEITSPTEGDVLFYDSTAQIWKNRQLPPGNGGAGVEEAPLDGNFYVRKDGAWFTLQSALTELGFVLPTAPTVADGGNFTTGATAATSGTHLDGGNFTTGTSTAAGQNTVDGGLITG